MRQRCSVPKGSQPSVAGGWPSDSGPFRAACPQRGLNAALHHARRLGFWSRPDWRHRARCGEAARELRGDWRQRSQLRGTVIAMVPGQRHQDWRLGLATADGAAAPPRKARQRGDRRAGRGWPQAAPTERPTAATPVIASIWVAEGSANREAPSGAKESALVWGWGQGRSQSQGIRVRHEGAGAGLGLDLARRQGAHQWGHPRGVGGQPTGAIEGQDAIGTGVLDAGGDDPEITVRCPDGAQGCLNVPVWLF